VAIAGRGNFPAGNTVRTTILTVLMACLTGGAALAQTATPEQKAQLVPTGALRAAIVTIPFLAKHDASGALTGVAPELASDMARALGVPYQPTAFKSPNEGIAALREGKADVTFLAPTAERSRLIDFAPAFMEMEVTIIVPAASPIRSFADADRPNRKIVVYERTAVAELLVKKLTRANVVPVRLGAWTRAQALLMAGDADAFADLRDQLVAHQPELPGSRIIDGAYGRNAVSIGYPKSRTAAATFVKDFTAAAIKSGLVTRAIEKAGVKGAMAPGR
jgi:polar amino acid transport system substrate-binding protein